MTELIRRLAAYSEYHRDPRNVATHVLGVPMIMLAVALLLSRPLWNIDGWTVTLAMIVSALLSLYYLLLNLRLGLLMTAILAITAWVAMVLAALPTPVWLGMSVVLFVVGWGLQLGGHALEGRKPAFLDDIRSLIIAPLFVIAELMFTLGCCKDLHAAVKAARFG